MEEKQKKRLDWALDKLNDVALAAYGLLAGEKWINVVTVGVSLPEAAQLFGLTMVLVAVWAIIGYLKGLLEEI